MLGCGKEMFAVSMGRDCLGWVRGEGSQLSGSDEVKLHMQCIFRTHQALGCAQAGLSVFFYF